MKKLLLVGLLLSFTSTFASEIVWVKLETRFTYKDYDYACSGMPMSPNVYFVAEMNNDKVAQASLRLSSDVNNEKNSISLTDEESYGIELFRDSKGHYWLKKLSLTTRALNWLFYADKSFYPGCSPKVGLKTLTPSSFIYSFDTASLDSGTFPYDLHSQTGVFTGLNVKEKPYRIELTLRQRPYTR